MVSLIVKFGFTKVCHLLTMRHAVQVHIAKGRCDLLKPALGLGLRRFTVLCHIIQYVSLKIIEKDC